MVAKIAAKNLSQDARNQVAAILGTNDAGLEAAMANAATWPDEIDKQATGTGNWHSSTCQLRPGSRSLGCVPLTTA